MLETKGSVFVHTCPLRKTLDTAWRVVRVQLLLESPSPGKVLSWGTASPQLVSMHLVSDLTCEAHRMPLTDMRGELFAQNPCALRLFVHSIQVPPRDSFATS